LTATGRTIEALDLFDGTFATTLINGETTTLNIPSR